jgi:hypothetical protein
MKRTAVWMFGMVLLVGPQTVLAQHRGTHGAGAAGAPTGATDSQDLKDFNRTVALQATPEQTDQFKQLMKSMEAARKKVHDLLQVDPKDSNPDALHRSYELADAVDDAQLDNARFVAGLSAAQKSGLKEFTKKLGKANSEISKQSKALRASGRSQAVVEKLDKALSDLQTNQIAIGREIGISSGTQVQTVSPSAQESVPHRF